MTAFVLVHGAWGGAHGFRHVRRLLRAEQHDVSTPSLTGVGERIHLSSPLVGLGTHIPDVVNHVLYEDLEGIVLVGFSYGGFVVTGALETLPTAYRTWSIWMHLSPPMGRRFGRMSGASPVQRSNLARIGS